MALIDHDHPAVLAAYVTTHYVIYHNPLDYPGKFVLRKWQICGEEGCDPRPVLNPAVFDGLDEARAAVPYGLLCIPRDDSDDPVIVETWI